MHSVDSDYTVHDGRRCIQETAGHSTSGPLTLIRTVLCSAKSHTNTNLCVCVRCCGRVRACSQGSVLRRPKSDLCVCVRVWAWLGGNVTTLICLAPTLLCVGTFLPFTQTMSNTYPQEAVAIHASR